MTAFFLTILASISQLVSLAADTLRIRLRWADLGMAGTLKHIKEALDKREDTEKWLFRLIGAYIILELAKAILPVIAG